MTCRKEPEVLVGVLRLAWGLLILAAVPLAAAIKNPQFAKPLTAIAFALMALSLIAWNVATNRNTDVMCY